MSNLFCCGQPLALPPSLVDTNFQPNHFVPLVQVQERDENITPKALKQKTISKVQPKITDVLKGTRRETSTKGMLFTAPSIHICVLIKHYKFHVHGFTNFMYQRYPQLPLKYLSQGLGGDLIN